MSKPKLQPLAATLRLIDSLSNEEKSVLFDYLRPAPKPRKPATEPKPERKPRARKATTEVTGFECCVKVGCGRPMDDNVHQLSSAPFYHEFVEPAGEAKGANV